MPHDAQAVWNLKHADAFSYCMFCLTCFPAPTSSTLLFFKKKIFFSSPFQPRRSFEQYDAYSGSSDIGHGDGGRLQRRRRPRVQARRYKVSAIENYWWTENLTAKGGGTMILLIIPVECASASKVVTCPHTRAFLFLAVVGWILSHHLILI